MNDPANHLIQSGSQATNGLINCSVSSERFVPTGTRRSQALCTSVCLRTSHWTCLICQNYQMHFVRQPAVLSPWWCMLQHAIQLVQNCSACTPCISSTTTCYWGTSTSASSASVPPSWGVCDAEGLLMTFFVAQCKVSVLNVKWKQSLSFLTLSIFRLISERERNVYVLCILFVCLFAASNDIVIIIIITQK
jgi:hypothetical protein